MSGGHWSYRQLDLDDNVPIRRLPELMEVLAEIAHDLDWGICCDTCQDCAEINSGRILIALFDYWWNQDDDDDDWDKFRARMRELSRANTCPRHKKDDVK